LDPVAQGRVQLLPAGNGPESQAVAVMGELRRLATLDPAWDWSRTAVIAREWEWLEPVRSWCEWAGIPARLAREDGHGFWRLRETQALLGWIEARGSRLVEPGGLRAWVGAQAPNPWWSLLLDALEAYELEEGAGEHPATAFVEWLAEWGRDLRRRPSGLTLVSAHRAKGMEFDHVAILDGGWERDSPGEDPDATRRLYYVAMTRARRNLILARLERGNPILDPAFGAAAAGDFLLRRAAAEGLPVPAELHRRHLRPPLKDLDLGFAGRREPGDRVHAALRRLEPGMPLQVQTAGDRWLLLDLQGTPVGRFAAGFRPPPGLAVYSATVAAILIRRKEDGEGDYGRWARCAAWELVIPDLVFEPPAIAETTKDSPHQPSVR
jgi:ATP-dependent DNA helicase RecQ